MIQVQLWSDQPQNWVTHPRHIRNHDLDPYHQSPHTLSMPGTETDLCSQTLDQTQSSLDRACPLNDQGEVPFPNMHHWLIHLFLYPLKGNLHLYNISCVCSNTWNKTYAKILVYRPTLSLPSRTNYNLSDPESNMEIMGSLL